MADRRSSYLSYLLRLWLEMSQDKALWRASLEEPGSGECQGFKDLESLFVFLQVRVANVKKDIDTGKIFEIES